MNKTSGRRQLRRDTPEVSHTAKPQAYCVMLSAAMNGNAATFNSFNDAGRSTPILRDRRRVLGGIAASYAGLAGTAIVSFNPLRPSPASAQAALHNPQAPCGRTKVVASDEATAVETSAGTIRGFKRKGVYIFKGVLYGASTSGANRELLFARQVLFSLIYHERY